MRRTRLALIIGAALVVAFAATPAIGGSGNSVVYSSLASNGPPSNLPSVGAEAYAYNEFGNLVAFADNSNTPRRLTSVVVTLSSWGCVEGRWYMGNCYTPGGSKFDLPMTLTIYEAGTGDVLATSTETFAVPYRPSVSSQCTQGRWYSQGLKTCFNGLAHDVTFHFGGQDVTLPDEVVFGITYNTSHYGYSPIGSGAACYSSSGGCPYDSLNIALSTDSTVGSNPGGNVLWRSTGGAFGPTWNLGGYVPAVEFKSSVGNGG